MTTEQAIILVRKLSGKVGSSVTKKTTYLVANIKDIEHLNREEMTTKLKRAVDLKKKGQNIIFLNEDSFLEKCKKNNKFLEVLLKRKGKVLSGEEILIQEY